MPKKVGGLQKDGEGNDMIERRLVNQARKTVLAERICCCWDFWKRTIGLLGKAKISPTEAYWLMPCRSVHTFGMAYPIDLFVLDRKNRVIAIVEKMKPNRVSRFYPKARSILEFAWGPHRDCEIGDQLKLEEMP